jgi:ABC-type sugar transport system ATPase subunit
MTTVRLENVSLEYTSQKGPMIWRIGRGSKNMLLDRAFEARMDMSYQEAREVQQGRKIKALDNVNLTIPDGKTMALIGPSGCGKTSLMRVVSGIESDYKGRVMYDGVNIEAIPIKERRLGVVFQNFALYPHFLGRGNLSFFFWVRRAPKEEERERIAATSEIMGFGFKDLLRRRPRKLSGGEKQRLAIARALVRVPSLFLLDEPLANLDAKLRVQTRVEIKRLMTRFAITSIYITHDQEEAVSLGDQIAVMRWGQIEQVGTYDELYQQPANAFVAGFLSLSPMNLFRGGVVDGGELHLDGLRVPLPEAVRNEVQGGQEVVLGARCESAAVLTGGPAAQGVRLRGAVEVIEPDFARKTARVYADTPIGSCAAMAPLDASLREGDRVDIVLPYEGLYFFGGEDERRLGETPLCYNANEPQ